MPYKTDRSFHSVTTCPERINLRTPGRSSLWCPAGSGAPSGHRSRRSSNAKAVQTLLPAAVQERRTRMSKWPLWCRASIHLPERHFVFELARWIMYFGDRGTGSGCTVLGSAEKPPPRAITEPRLWPNEWIPLDRISRRLACVTRRWNSRTQGDFEHCAPCEFDVSGHRRGF